MASHPLAQSAILSSSPPLSSELSDLRTSSRTEAVEPLAPAPLSLRRNVSWTFAGNLVYAGSQWAILMILAKLGSPEMVGQFALGLAITAPIMLFANLQLRAVQATDSRQEYEFGDYLALRLLTTGLALLLIAMVALLGAFPGRTALVILALGLAKAFESISDVIFGLLQQRERMDRIARLQMLKGLLSILAVGGTLYLTNSVLWSTVALAIVWALRLFVYDIPSARWVQGERDATVRPNWSTATMARLAWLALPVGVVTALGSLETNIPRYMIEHQLGIRELGIFAAMSYVLVAGHTVTSALAQSALPRLARFYAMGQLIDFRRLLLKLIGTGGLIGSMGVAGSLLAGEQILATLYTAEYAAYPGVFAWLMCAFALRFICAFLRTALRAMRRFQVQLPLHVVGLGLLAYLTVLLVVDFGLHGAALAIFITTFVELLAYAALVAWYLMARTAKQQVEPAPIGIDV